MNCTSNINDNKFLVSIVIPAHNEEKNIPIILNDIREILKINKINGEIVLVNDNSTDGTGAVAEKFSHKFSNIKVVHRKPPRGVGRALKDGFRASSGDILITMDCDISHEPKEIPKLLNAIDNYDIVLGSRFIKGGELQSDVRRKFFSRAYNYLARLLMGMKINDITTGFRAHKKRVLHALDLRSNGFEIHAEIPIKAHMMGFRIKEIPITYKKRKYGKTKLKYVKVGPGYLFILLYSFFQKTF